MGLNLYLPNISNGKATVKDCIIQILSQDWPLSIKKLYFQIKKKFGIDCTYQAVFKAVNELLQMEVVKKGKEGFQINLKWLKHIHRFTATTETNYYTKNRMDLIEGIKESKQEGNISILTFTTMFDVEKYLYYLVKNQIMNSNKPQSICYHHNHEWRPLYYMRAEHTWIRNIIDQGHSSYILCAGSTPLDKFCARFYKNLGCSIKLNANCASTCELLVVGDLVIEIYLPHDLIRILDKEFSRIKQISSVKPEKLIEDIFEKKNDIQVIIRKDKNISEQIMKQTVNVFGKKKY